MRRKALLAVVVSACFGVACSTGVADAPAAEDLQADLALRDVTFTAADSGVAADSGRHVVDRAARGSGMPSRNATWVYEGAVTARGNQGQALAARPVWAVYFADVEQFGLGEPVMIRSDWVVFVDKESETIVLGPTAVGVTTTEACPPRDPAFGTELPDRGARSGPGGAWALTVAPGETARVTVLVTVPPDVVLQSLSFGILAAQSGAELWRRTVASHLPTGTYRFTVTIDGQGLPRGVQDFVATWDVWHQGGVPCDSGHRVGDGGTRWLGWIDIARP